MAGIDTAGATAMSIAPSLIVTVAGEVRPEEIGAVLPFEHLLGDFVNKDDEKKPASLHLFYQRLLSGAEQTEHMEEISLKTLADLKYNPYSNLKNLQLSNPDEAAYELERLKKSYSCISSTEAPFSSLASSRHLLIVHMSTGDDKRDVRALQDISKRAGISIVLGSAPRGTEEEEVKELQIRLERDLLFGFQEHPEIRAGVIGEIFLTDIADKAQMKVLEVAVKAHVITSAPLFLSLDMDRHSSLVTPIVDYIQREGGDLSKVVLCHMDLHIKNLTYLQDILKIGMNLSFDLIGWAETFNCISRVPRDAEIAEAIDLLCSLESGKYVSQVLLSQGVRFRIQWTRYGGYGYGHLFKNFLPRRLSSVSPFAVRSMVRDNPLRLLTWARPPQEKKAAVEYAVCSWCKEKFIPVEGEYFTKFTFQYCGTKCLRKHRIAGFKPI